jgi:aldehyde dehydrogenase (NAD+)
MMATLTRLPLCPTTYTKCLTFATCVTLNNFAAFSSMPSRRTIMTKRDFYINGRWTPPVTTRDFHVMCPAASIFNLNSYSLFTLQVIDPSTEAPCAVISLGSDADVDAGVAAASAALPSWSATAPITRRAYVDAILSQYLSRSYESTLSTKLQTPDTFNQSR